MDKRTVRIWRAGDHLSCVNVSSVSYVWIDGKVTFQDV
jgi:hypothetical protein